MIVGLGTDIIKIKRIENVILKYGHKFKWLNFPNGSELVSCGSSSSSGISIPRS